MGEVALGQAKGGRQVLAEEGLLSNGLQQALVDSLLVSNKTLGESSLLGLCHNTAYSSVPHPLGFIHPSTYLSTLEEGLGLLLVLLTKVRVVQLLIELFKEKKHTQHKYQSIFSPSGTLPSGFPFLFLFFLTLTPEISSLTEVAMT